MARQRFIWPDLWSDPGFASLEPLAQVLYIGCFSNADDQGRLHGDMAFLKAIVLPRSQVSLRKLNTARSSMLKAMPKLTLYEVDNCEYLAFTNWSEWQKPKYPRASRLPDLPEEFRDMSGTVSGNGSGNDSSVGWVGLGLPPQPPQRKRRKTRAPKDIATVTVKYTNVCPACGLALKTKSALDDHIHYVHSELQGARA